MALVTIQRSPSVATSPQSINPESAGPDEDDAAKSKSLSECYFAGKSAALVLGPNEILLRSDVHRLSISSTGSASSTVTGAAATAGSDIQQHLQSMFYLLRPEETLKMAVKLESIRAGRTRYLVVVSRPGVKNQTLQHSASTPTIIINHEEQQQITTDNNNSITATTTTASTIAIQNAQITRQNPSSSNNTKKSSSSSNISPTDRSSGGGGGRVGEANNNFSPNKNQLTDDSCSCPSNLNNISIITTTTTTNSSDNKCVQHQQQHQHQPQQQQQQQQHFSSSSKNDCDKNLSSANITNNINNLRNYHKSDDFCKNVTLCDGGDVGRGGGGGGSCGDDENGGNCSSSDHEESCLLGIDCNEKTSVGLVLRILADTHIRLDGDGGFSVSVCGRTHIFKPVSVQAMWSALQTLHKVSSKAREHNYFPGRPSHDWVSYYEDHIESDRSCLNEWHAMDSLESRRPPSPDTVRNKPTEREETERVIRTALKEIMMLVDLDEVTSKYIRGRLEEHLDMDLAEFKSFIDEEMLTILGQMDAPTEIFDHVYLGSEWNASNLEELQRNGVGHILNVTREIDNFFPGMFDYFNVRVYDDEKTDLLKHWDKTFKYITRAKIAGSKVLVHCKMGVSRSASVVIAYAMKANNWNFEEALRHVKEKRNCIKPNKSFLSQLETYQGMLDAMKNKEKLQRSKSETNLKSPKDARLLPGSEPTPLIQALNVGKLLRGNLSISGKELRKCGDRPKSWSPDNVESSVLLPKPQSQSLEHLGPPLGTQPPVALPPPNPAVGNTHCENDTEAKHIRLPCCNGQNYSVSQNQAVHLQAEEINSMIPSVKLIISELEAHKRMRKTREDLNIELNATLESSSSDNDDCQHSKNWDPGERLGGNEQEQNQICDSPVWTSSAQIIHQTPIVSLSISETKELQNSKNCSEAPAGRKEGDPFSSQLDRVFDREERKHVPAPIQLVDSGHCLSQSNTATTIPSDNFVSRQSSWSSVDSAVVMGYTGEMRDTPSRHSSWGSGDNRLPSRNSSWGSYDIRNSKNLNRDKLKFNKDEILSMSNSGIFAYDKDEIPWHPGTVKRTKQKIEERSVAKRLCSDNTTTLTNDENKPDNESQTTMPTITPAHRIHKSRCHSEEMLGDRSLSSSYYSRLSASAPETSAMHFIDGDTTVPLRRSQFKTRFSIDETTMDKKSDEFQAPESGTVRNLKMNFEAKAAIPASAAPVPEPTTKVRSLPASPVAAHVDLSTSKSTTEKEIQNVKGLVDKYEETKMRQNTSPLPVSAPTRQRPRSTFELKPSQTVGPLMLTHSKINAKTEESRRPPVPPTVVKSATTIGPIPATGTIMAQTKPSNKKAQQHGKTHPLSKLKHGISKQRVNTVAYNTM